MNLCFYCTSGKDFKTFDYKVIYNFKFIDYVVKVIEIKTLEDLIDFSDKINCELILTDTQNLLCCNSVTYSVDFIKIFTNKYPYAIEIYDYYRE